MLKVLENTLENQLEIKPIYNHVNALQEGVKAKQYQPLMSRIKCGRFFLSNQNDSLRDQNLSLMLLFHLQKVLKTALNTMQKSDELNYTQSIVMELLAAIQPITIVMNNIYVDFKI